MAKLEPVDPAPYRALSGASLCAALDTAIAGSQRASLSLRVLPATARAHTGFDAGPNTSLHLLELELGDADTTALATWARNRGASVIVELPATAWEGQAIAARARRVISLLGPPTRVRAMPGTPTSERGEPAEGYPGVSLVYDDHLAVALAARRTSSDEHATVLAAFVAEAGKLAGELGIPID